MLTLNLNPNVPRRLQACLGMLAIVLLMVGSVSAQSFKATVVGQITDANGALDATDLRGPADDGAIAEQATAACLYAEAATLVGVIVPVRPHSVRVNGVKVKCHMMK